MSLAAILAYARLRYGDTSTLIDEYFSFWVFYENHVVSPFSPSKQRAAGIRGNEKPCLSR